MEGFTVGWPLAHPTGLLTEGKASGESAGELEVALVAVAVIIGVLVGSFANVPIHRWPTGSTVTEPKRSTCPACGTLITARDNVPVVSWLLLRRRCRHCLVPIAARYAMVEILTAALFGAVAWVWGLSPLLPALLVLTWSLVVAAVIDLEHRIIPDRLTLRLPFVVFPLLVGAAAFDGAWTDLLRGIVAGIAVPGLMLLLSEAFRLVRGKPGIGMGDIKLAISLGLVVGYLGGIELVIFAYGTIVSAVAIAVVLMLAGRAKLASRIPFGPYLAVGAMLPIVAGDQFSALVRSLLGL